jgi:dTDP-4-amino-4,6-dideoxygalactose transaminase
VFVPYTNPTGRAADRAVVLELIEEAAASGNFILKGHAAELERQVAEATGAAHAVVVASGSDALKLALRALGVGGGEVLTPAFGFAATAGIPTQLGARPRFCDVEPRTGCLALDGLAERLNDRTQAVVAAHLFCHHADAAGLRRFADEAGVPFVEDFAVNFGATVQGRPAGRWGDVGIGSFFTVKPVGGIGEGGVIVTDDDALARRVRMLRNHGQDGITRFLHHEIGYNSRMDEVVAGYLVERLKKRAALVGRRAEIAARYDRGLSGLVPLLELPPLESGRAWYAYVVQTDRRESLRAWLAGHGIEARACYDPPLARQPAFAYLGHSPRDFPNAERIARRNLALPIWPELSDAQVDRVVAAVTSFFAYKERPAQPQRGGVFA